MKSLRDLPSVDVLLQTAQAEQWVKDFGRPLTINAVRITLEEIRDEFRNSRIIPDIESILTKVGVMLDGWTASSLIPVINASGVVLHTNLGRAPLSEAASRAMRSVAMGYSNLEYDLEKGKRGSRLIHSEKLLQLITGSQAALVVNNNAAAVLLILTALARRKAVVIARSQLVEIGGGFRVPDVMKQSGARLVEIGTTNRVHITDYEQAIVDENPSLILRAHRSNFRITGFTSEPSLADITQLAHQTGIPVVDDLGSGTLLDTASFGMEHEPTVSESLASGADLVCFSGDKLLGGPQAGIIIGKADLIARLKKHPLARAIRADKLCLAALSATLLHYLKNEALHEVPVWRMISFPLEALHQRAKAWADQLGYGEVVLTQSTVGGGSLPGETLPTYALALTARSPNKFLDKLRQSFPPIIARLENDRVILDPRTVLPDQETDLLTILHKLQSDYAHPQPNKGQEL